MLFACVIVYLAGSVALGLWASRNVKGSKDFAVAGRSLPFSITFATVFATWFGAESIFGVSSKFLKEGLAGLACDPFGATCCLLLSAWIFSSRLYKTDALTLGDYLRSRFGPSAETAVSACIVLSYLGWVAAQIKALGILFASLGAGALSDQAGMAIGAFAVLAYTLAGGMLSVAILDFAQMIVMIAGLGFIAWLMAGKADGGFSGLLAQASAAGKLSIPEHFGTQNWLAMAASFATMALGSLPQQDVYQRITSAKSAKIAFWGSCAGALLYFAYSFVPAFIAWAGLALRPELVAPLLDSAPERIIPAIVQSEAGLAAQILFYGAVLSAIMSTASATLLAPSVALSENIVSKAFPAMDDRGRLRAMRLCMCGLAALTLGLALASSASLYEMVAGAYKITLAGAFAPLAGGIFWKGATERGALASCIGGALFWALSEAFGSPFGLAPQIAGFAVSCIALAAASLADTAWTRRRAPLAPGNAEGACAFLPPDEFADSPDPAEQPGQS